MRIRSSLFSMLIFAAVAALVFVPRAWSQGASSDNHDNIAPGDYLRFSAGATSPVSPKGNLRDWGSGTTYNLVWENWGAGSNGTDLTGFGFGIGYTMLPLKNSFFVQNFVPTQVTGQTASATAANAGVLEITTNLRIRIPAPFVMPHVSLGLGFMNWHPGTIHYTTTTGATADAKQQSRSGAEFSIGGGVDRQLFDRYGLFAEALYTYGFTNVGQGLATPTGTCAASGCDVLKNTTLGTLRGGLRVRIGE
jgi:hypothetical protein